MRDTYRGEWLGWTEADYVQLALILGWTDDPWRQALQDSFEFLSIVLYCTHTKSA